MFDWGLPLRKTANVDFEYGLLTSVEDLDTNSDWGWVKYSSNTPKIEVRKIKEKLKNRGGYYYEGF